MLGNTLLLFLLIGTALCKPLHKRWDDVKTKHAWTDSAPAGWEVVGPAPSEERLTVRIGLKQDKFDDLVEHLYAVSDPSHHRYGQHLTKAQVDALSAPHPDSTGLVEDWLSHHGILHNPECQMTRSSSGDWILVSISVGQLERMLETKYNVYKHSATGTTLIRTTSYSLPTILHGHVTVVSPATYFVQPKPQRGTKFARSAGRSIHERDSAPASCNNQITPDCLRKLYNIDYKPISTGNSLGVVGFLDEFPNHSDLKTFLQNNSPNAAVGDFTVVAVNGGGDDQSKPGIEGNLDIQYTLSLTYPTPNTYYSVGGSPPFAPDDSTPTNTNEPYLDFLDFILGKEPVPQTITISYTDDEQTVPKDYAEDVCNKFAQLGARGSSVLFSSGDFGVGDGSCLSNDGTKKTQFLPMFPASCPFVTAVGATNGTSQERAAYFSGGGFSNYFPQPPYQSRAVESYLGKLGDKYADLFNPAGRAFPDVAAQGVKYVIVSGGQNTLASGTSASSPTFAAVISLLNDIRTAKGLRPLGFLNPWLYSGGFAGLNDITSGSNPGCNTNGFDAGEGWDPVTGLGTPDFRKLRVLMPP